MGQRWFLLVLIALGACFSPKFNDGAIQCGPDQLCPPGFECAAGVCRSGDQPIDAAPGTVSLSVTRSGAGMGGVQSAPVGLDCGTMCTVSFPSDTMVTLTATPLAGSTFTGWSGGACSGTTPTCTVSLTSNIVVNAEFGRIMRRLTVISGGNGTGAITSNPAGITCPGVCTITVPDGAPVVLTATPTGASTFVGWTASVCSGTGACSFNITADTTLTGSFALDYSVIVTKSGMGMGTVTSSPTGIDCGLDCNEAYAVNTSVTLTAVASGNSSFVGWSGACSGAGSCVVTVSAAVMVTAMFDLQPLPLSVAIIGNGTVTSSPSGIMCTGINSMTTGDCSEPYAGGTMVTLTASPALGWMFTGWSDPNCPGTGTCTVTVTTMTGVTATFAPELHTLKIVKAGNGDGVVQGISGAIDCGADCSEDVASGTMVTLFATPSMGSTVASWSAPGCGGQICNVTVTAATTVTVTFTLTTHNLTVSVNGGNGSISSPTPGGIDCGVDCFETYDYGTAVTLVPDPDIGWEFSSWAGACTGSGACVVTMVQSFSVFATFQRTTHLLRVVLGGTGSGQVTSSPPGIVCNAGASADCMELYDYDTNVTLTAMANAPSTFIGWSGGGCTGTLSTCVVDMISAHTVTARFSPPPNRMFITSQTYIPGSLNGLGGADAVCQAAAFNAALPGTYRAWLSTPAANAVDRIGIASGWVRTDGRPFANTAAEIASGLLFHPPRITETGTMDVLEVSAMTGTFDGVFHSQNGSCGFYTNPGDPNGVTTGISSAGSEMFSAYGSTGCNTPARLYCFGVDRMATVATSPPATAVRRAFMRLWVPGGGIADADAQCQADATAKLLPGTYKALLATTMGSALSRFNLTGRPWVRVDHVPILASSALWATATYFESGPNLSADGSFAWGNYVNWAGAPSLTAGGTAATTCNDWTNTNMTAMYGIAGNTRIGHFFGNSGAFQCNFTSATITCLQD